MAYAPHNPWTAGEKDAAAKLQTLTDALKAIGDPWQSWTPVLTSSGTAPTYSSSGTYVHAGRWVVFEFNITITTAGTGNYTITLPVTGLNLFPRSFVIAGCYDQSAGLVYPRHGVSTGSNTAFVLNNTDSTRVSATSPFTFASPDQIAGYGSYQAAANP
jgi:hypothetical protein